MDAPLVQIEAGDPSPAVDDVDWTLGEELIECVFHELELVRRAYGAELVGASESSEEALTFKQAATDALLRYGLHHSLSEMKRVATFRLKALGALIVAPYATTLLHIYLASDDFELLKSLTEWLDDQLDFAKVGQPPSANRWLRK